MIEVDEALTLVRERAHVKPPCRMPTGEALGLVLAEDIISDVDSPPHDKALVDGYAVRSADVSGASSELTVLEEVTAGEVPAKEVVQGTTTRIMTGAPLPAGADAVVMVERTELLAPTVVRINESSIRPRQNIMARAASMKRGERVLSENTVIGPVQIGLLAEVGRADVLVRPHPSVAVLATGDELVAADTQPEAGQIRNSNGPMICALVSRAGGLDVDLGIARDNSDELRRLIARGLESDVLVLSGGVSAGVRDLVPSVLAALNVEQVFHKVNLKPGKPLWFGVSSGSPRVTLVFGLPGNPVSSLVCFELFVRPAIEILSGRACEIRRSLQARLTKEHLHRSDRPTYWPAAVTECDGERLVEPLAWQGSADLRTLANANGLAFFPPGERRFTAGESVDVHPL